MCSPPIERGLGAYRPLELELDAAVAAARAGGETALSFFGKRLHADWKADDSPVSEADRAADAVIRDSLEAAFPDDAVLTEESDERPGKSGRRWIIDPVDAHGHF
jgi:fructose-1,6-bisphosphatase/inositol monophosphatase family enzyme